ncbi:MAG: DUF6263 family protein [Myxococcota bacterium]|nr:DUF6263 family protein [Myxococcota bacterium]
MKLRFLCIALSLLYNIPNASADDGNTTVRLLDAGLGAKVTLRLRPKAGQKQHFTFTTSMQMAMKVNGTRAPQVEIPPIVQSMNAEILSVDPNGDIRFRITFSDAKLGDGGAPDVRNAIIKELKGLASVRMVGTMTDRGVNKAITVEGKEKLTEIQSKLLFDLERSFKQLSQPFPEDPIAPGAKWKTETHLTMNAIPMITDTYFELVSVSKNAHKYALKVATKVRTDAESVKLPNPPITMSINSLKGKGEGQSKGDTRLVLPISSTVDSTVGISMSSVVAGERITLDMDMDMNMSVKHVKQ